MKVGIINVTGYVGAELVRLINRHPCVELASIASRNPAASLGELYPHLSDIALPIEKEIGQVDIAFSALPHKASAEAAATALEAGARVIDISADFRLRDAKVYEAWYGVIHPAPHLLAEAVYGLPELHRSDMAKARLVANPGCYPTSAILGLAPAVKNGVVEPDIVVDSKSGVSGAGRATSLTTHYSEVNENVQAYSLDGHRHQPEIAQELEGLNQGSILSVTFLPHLIPMTRGILSSCYAKIKEGTIPISQKGKEALIELYRDFYKGEPFVRVVDAPPQTKQTWGSNFCLIFPTIDLRAGRLIVISCIDNLVKGAAGQAIQNMNIMLGLSETTGLEGLAIYP